MRELLSTLMPRTREALGALLPGAVTLVLDDYHLIDAQPVHDSLAFLLELRLDEGPLGPEQAGRRLDEWWAENKT